MKKFVPYIVLFIVTVLAYGLLTPRLGFYWDELPMTWIRYQLGPEALTRYFSTNRPVWGGLHQLTTRLIPQVPFYWQLFALLWRWLCAVMVYLICAKVWKGKPWLAMGVGLIFLVYPGFNQHWAAYLYSHFYIVLFFFLFSFLCTLLAIEQPKRFWLWTGVGMFFAALNLWMMEYFYILELARIGFILAAIRDEELTPVERIKRALKLWFPYLFLFLLAVISRLFIFNNQVYGISLTGQLRSAPFETMRTLAHSIKVTLRLVLKEAWLKMFEMPNFPDAESILWTYYLVVVLVVLAATAGFILLPKGEGDSTKKNILDAVWMIGLGAFCVFLSGWPFWLIGFVTTLNWPASRFTLPFMFGVGLLVTGLIALVPFKRVQIVLLVSLVSLSAGKQYLTSHEYARDWETQKDLFWQMVWRAPSIKPGTMILMNEGALQFYADNSLSAELNQIYAPDNHSAQVDYLLFYPTTRFRNALPEISPDIPIYYDYLAGEFNGNTSQTLSFYYSPPTCLRLLDAETERVNRLIPENSLMRYAARLTNPGLVQNEQVAQLPDIYGPEPEHNFCFYYQKADLARQLGDWDRVAEFADRALTFDDHPFEPAEQLVFIEGYAHTGQWGRALELSKQAYGASEDIMGVVLCRLWRRVGEETDESAERTEAITEIQSMFACSP